MKNCISNILCSCGMLYKGETNHFSKDYEKKKVYMKSTEKKKWKIRHGMSYIKRTEVLWAFWNDYKMITHKCTKWRWLLIWIDEKNDSPANQIWILTLYKNKYSGVKELKKKNGHVGLSYWAIVPVTHA